MEVLSIVTPQNALFTRADPGAGLRIAAALECAHTPGLFQITTARKELNASSARFYLPRIPIRPPHMQACESSLALQGELSRYVSAPPQNEKALQAEALEGASGAGGTRTHKSVRTPVFETGAIPIMRRLQTLSLRFSNTVGAVVIIPPAPGFELRGP